MAPSHVLRCCQRVVGWIPVLFITLVVCWSYYAYVLELCIFTIKSDTEKALYLVFFHLFFIMFVWSYWKTIFASPANPTKEFCLSKSDKELYEREERQEIQQEILRKAAKDLPVYTSTATKAIRYCDRCQLIKPDRCHHCSTCDVCVLKMDHHCPWVNTCVGFSNYKFFLLFLMYSLFYCLFIAATVLQYFIRFWTLCRSKSEESCPQNELPDTRAKFHVLFLFFVSAMFFISILSLFSYHCWLVSKNRSTIEAFRAPFFRTGPEKDGFSLGFSKNLREVFGDEKKYWLLPVFTSLGDGCSFPTRLVFGDPEQNVAAVQADIAKHAGPSQPFPARPLSESQNRLLGSDTHWADGSAGEDHTQKEETRSHVSVCVES
ncbi:palmitoyltransferase ZDHHC20 isoform X1 [Rana temporaria]|uniref:palmitoyltransferase ZDHHC20 isoform X1 n=1 Tax=Rana temporaria TaxID=8407 RepID=UPI001AAC5611|nr:palmitoyltransferase ZDHHC20 isoform X1 [Rana temporaria]XP_040196458.1 palmitoyltransferase ZDHHC20 isoform X1 [Rana temporaria]